VILSSATAQGGIARTKDFKTWERLPDLKTASPQQRNVVLHPEFVQGKYAFYTRPQDGFIEAARAEASGGTLRKHGSGRDRQRIIIDDRAYHTIKEVKNGLGPAPIKTATAGSSLPMASGIPQPDSGTFSTCSSPISGTPTRPSHGRRDTSSHLRGKNAWETFPTWSSATDG